MSLLLALAALLALPCSAFAGTTQPGFADAQVAAVGSPTGLAPTPDGRLLITTQGGRVRVYENGALVATPALDLTTTTSKVCTGFEKGLLGITVDPAFATNHFVYLFAARRKPDNTCVNRVSRFVMSGNTIQPGTEVALLDNIYVDSGGSHSGGDLHFGKDGYLYVSVGDGNCDYAGGSCGGTNDASRDTNVPLGKILRITRDGAVPVGNPWAATGGRCAVNGKTTPGMHCQETFAWGLRNPFRFAFDPNASGTRFYINDVGQYSWEEIDEGIAGVDYGWNIREGKCRRGSTTVCPAPPPGMTDPIFAYNHAGPCGAITGGAFVPAGVWPAPYSGAYLFADYDCGKIFRLVPGAGGTYTSADFATDLGASSAVAMTFAPFGSTQALYYTTYANGGEVRRISFTGSSNRPPTAEVAASPTSGTVPLTVNFDGRGSSDPDAGDTLRYVWSFGDGSATRETTTPTTAYTYGTAGTYTATLRVRDSKGALSDPVTVRIDAGNAKPVPKIEAPLDTLRFRVGQDITLRGSATDAEDGTLADSRLSWEVIRRHEEHTHPFMPPTMGNNLHLTAPGPEDFSAAATSYLEIRLTATDSKGASSTVTQALRPHNVNLAFQSDPSGLELQAGGFTFLTPQTFLGWDGQQFTVDAAAQTDSAGRSWEFASWSDGGAASHLVTAPSTDATYKATFRQVGGSTGGLVGQYFDNANLTTPKLTRTDPTVNFDWGQGSPDPSIGTDTFSVRWTGQVQPRFSELYRFYTTTDDGVRLWVNGQQLVNDWTNHSAKENSGTIALTAGQKYDIRLEYYENISNASARLAWSSARQAREIVPASQLSPPPPPPPPPPSAGTGLKGQYFDTSNLTTLKLTRTDPGVSFDWDVGSPDPSIGADTFSARWTGQVQPRFSELYRFYTTTDDGVRLWVNGQQLVNDWTNHSAKENSGTIALTAGQKYDIRLEYYENIGRASAWLAWSSASQARQSVPAAQLYPAP